MFGSQLHTVAFYNGFTISTFVTSTLIGTDSLSSSLRNLNNKPNSLPFNTNQIKGQNRKIMMMKKRKKSLKKKVN